LKRQFSEQPISGLFVAAAIQMLTIFRTRKAKAAENRRFRKIRSGR
jgi:hypothetical protein